MRQQPRLSQFVQAMSARLNPGLQAFHGVVIGVLHVFLHLRAELPTRAFRCRFSALVFAGQKAAGQRIVGHEADVVGLAVGQDLAFDVAFQHLVFGLNGHEG